MIFKHPEHWQTVGRCQTQCLIEPPKNPKQKTRQMPSAGVKSASPDSPELKGKNAGPTGAVLMIDANQVWDVDQAIEYVKGLEEIKPWWLYHNVVFASWLSMLAGL